MKDSGFVNIICNTTRKSLSSCCTEPYTYVYKFPNGKICVYREKCDALHARVQKIFVCYLGFINFWWSRKRSHFVNYTSYIMTKWSDAISWTYRAKYSRICVVHTATNALNNYDACMKCWSFICDYWQNYSLDESMLFVWFMLLTSQQLVKMQFVVGFFFEWIF